MRNFAADLAFSARVLQKSPVFSLSVIFILALAIGANSAVFSVVDAVLLRSLPFSNVDRLVMVWEKNPALGPSIGQRVPPAYSNFLEWSKRAIQFEGLAGFEDANFNLTGGAEPQRIAGARASSNFFHLLGVTPRIGTDFESVAQNGEAIHTVVLSDEFFRSQFGGDASVLGRTLTLNDIAYTIVGVLPAEFHLPATREGQEQRKPDLWVPYGPHEQQRDAVEFNRRKMQVFGKLRPSVALEPARAEMNAIGQALAREDPAQNTGFGINLFPVYVEDVGKDQRRNLLVLFAAVGFVLLIGCANVANLMLGRASSRAREMAIRRALGASRGRLISQLLSESLLLATCGGAFGLMVAHYGIKALLAFKPAGINRPDQIQLGLPVLLFTSAISILASIGFGIVPAIRAARTGVAGLISHARNAGSGQRRSRTRQLLVTIEVALACMLLIGAAFMMKSLLAVLQVDPGFRPDHLLTMKFSLPGSHYKNNEQIAAFCRQALDKISTLPGVKNASFSDGLPLTRIRMTRFVLDDRPPPARGSEPTADMRGIFTADYLDAIGLRLIAGRNFTPAELADKQPVAIINQTLAHQLWPNENAIGKRIRSLPTKTAPTPVVSTVIGIVADTHQTSLEEPTRPEITKPMVDYTQLTLSVRSDSDPESLVGAVKNQIWSLDKNLPVFEVQTMQQVIDSSTSQRRFESFVMTTFAALAMLLASIGIYGVLASLVAQRTNEIGIRIALGARTGHVMQLVLGEGARMVALGLLLGTTGGFALSRVLGSLFFGVSPTTPTTYFEVIVLMMSIASVACALPTWRAIRVNPVDALRYE